MTVQSAADSVRRRIGASIFEKVAGPEGPNHRRVIHQAEGDRWFAGDRPIQRVHGDSSMFVGGIRALLLQSMHPLAMAAVAQHSDFRGDPWGRLQRTSYFLAVTTFGRTDDAQAAIARVRAVHQHVTGTAPDGRPYAATDPHLLTWVHIAEADSFLRAHTRFGTRPLDQAGRDGYVADMARIGIELGVPDPPRTEAELADRIGQYRPELAATADARAAARFLLISPPLPAPGPGPGGPEGRSAPAVRPACTAGRSPRPSSPARPAGPWSTPSAGPPPRLPPPRPPSPNLSRCETGITCRCARIEPLRAQEAGTRSGKRNGRGIARQANGDCRPRCAVSVHPRRPGRDHPGSSVRHGWLQATAGRTGQARGRTGPAFAAGDLVVHGDRLHPLLQ